MRFLICFSALLAFSTSPAFACKFRQIADPAERKAEALRQIRAAQVIGDMIVIRAYESPIKPALLRVTRLYKGPKGQKVFAVGGTTSCHIQFRQVGMITRVLLFGGPKEYEATMYVNNQEEIMKALGLPAKPAR